LTDRPNTSLAEMAKPRAVKKEKSQRGGSEAEGEERQIFLANLKIRLKMNNAETRGEGRGRISWSLPVKAEVRTRQPRHRGFLLAVLFGGGSGLFLARRMVGSAKKGTSARRETLSRPRRNWKKTKKKETTGLSLTVNYDGESRDQEEKERSRRNTTGVGSSNHPLANWALRKTLKIPPGLGAEEKKRGGRATAAELKPRGDETKAADEKDQIFLI